VDLARVQFATTSIYHFLFVPPRVSIKNDWATVF